MRFDSEILHACQTSTGCEGTGTDGQPPRDPRCSDPAFCMANPDICGTNCGNAEPCSDPDYHATHLSECEDDPRCSDPVFAMANPALCLGIPTLILKPEYVVREVGKSVQYTAVLLLDGEETELTDGVLFSSGDTGIAVIASTAGNATGLNLGIVTIVAQYGNLYAYAQLEIIGVGECAVRTSYFDLLIDHSKSTSGPFSGLTASRIAFAKKQAVAFSDTVNLAKDTIGLMSFDSDSAELLGFITDAADLPLLKQGINAIAVNNSGRTNIGNALTEAKVFLELNAPGSNDLKCVVLFSDGENNEGTDPIAIATQMKSEGFIIFVVGLRAKGNAFKLLDKISTGGFFINALPSNETSVAGWLAGLKGYICSGNCEPAGGETLGQGSLNFTNFLNWTVTENHVDLIGKNEGGPELYDFLPGNGLYVDLCGSLPPGSGADLGKMKQSGLLSLEVSTLYNVTLRLAGNQRENKTGTVLVEVYDSADVLLNDQTFVLGGFDDFSEFAMQFTTGSNTEGYIVVSQQSIEAGATSVFGCLWDSIVVARESDDEVIFEDDFDGDNASFIEPACPPAVDGFGYATGEGYSYCYGSGCLTQPVPAMTPDPAPYGDIETA